MVTDSQTALQLSSSLLQIKAIQIQTTNPFQWASGWLSPIYCDNRKALSHPNIRIFVKNKLTALVKDKFPDVQVIAGVATGAIAIGALVADELGLPFIYIRASSKGHGLGNRIEGDLSTGQKVVVVEDLISTGMSSLDAVKCLREAGKEVAGLVSIFTYGFDVAKANFEAEKCTYFCLSDYEHLLDAAVEANYIQSDQLDLLKEWRADPANWKIK